MCAVFYARDVLKNRFYKAEQAIALDACWAFNYATDVIKGTFPQAEKEIATHPGFALRYAVELIKGRFVEAEPVIALSCNGADSFSTYGNDYFDAFGHQFDEHAAGLHPRWAYRYARDVVSGKLPPKLHQKMQMWGMSNEHKGNKDIKLYLNSKKYQ